MLCYRDFGPIPWLEVLAFNKILKILCENSCEFNRQSIVIKTLNTGDILENYLGWCCPVL